MVEGKLAEERNVQVAVVETARGPFIKLLDEDGVFLEVPPSGEGNGEELGSGGEDGEAAGGEDESPGGRGGGGGAPKSPTTAALEESERALVSARAHAAKVEADLERVARRNTELTDEVRELDKKLGDERERYQALWRMSCEQLTNYDDMVAFKEEEIRMLRARVDSLRPGALPVTDATRPTLGGIGGDSVDAGTLGAGTPDRGRVRGSELEPVHAGSRPHPTGP